MTFMSFDFSFSFNHLLASPYGSMNRGYLSDYVAITAFSTEKLSLGKPYIFQSRILIGVSKVSSKLYLAVKGTLLLSKLTNHLLIRVSL